MDFKHSALMIQSNCLGNLSIFTYDTLSFEAGGGAVDWGNKQVRFPKVSLEFVIDWMLHATLTEMSTRNIS
jgi:hypothetical protein